METLQGENDSLQATVESLKSDREATDSEVVQLQNLYREQSAKLQVCRAHKDDSGFLKCMTTILCFVMHCVRGGGTVSDGTQALFQGVCCCLTHGVV